MSASVDTNEAGQRIQLCQSSFLSEPHLVFPIMARTKSPASAQSTATIGFEAKLWLTADKLRNTMDAAEYKHVVLGLIFLKYISDTFEEHRAKLLAGKGDYAGDRKSVV